MRATRILLLAASAAVIALAAGCTDQCQTKGCPQGKVCSLVTDNCLPPSQVYGPPCNGPQDCHRQVCLTTGDPANPSVCTGLCGSGEPGCPTGFACTPVSDNNGGTAQVCTPAGNSKIGDACQSSGDCKSGLCLALTTSQSVCTAQCTPGASGTCGTGDVGCEAFQDSQGTIYNFCVAGGSGLPGDACPNGITDCDLTKSDTCLSNSDGSITLCAPACPNGADDCKILAGSCCQDLGASGSPAPYCLPSQYCACQADCIGKTCGDDGCGGSCGTCATGTVCQSGSCVACTPACNGAVCGSDGCGGSCGTCGATQICQQGQCVSTCTPNCAGAVCGDDGCGGSCGVCQSPLRCHAGACIDPASLLVDVKVLDPAANPPTLWGLGEYQSAPSIVPPVTYGDGPQAGTTQTSLCGTTVVCSSVAALTAGTSYQLVLGYDPGTGTVVHCTATFTPLAAGGATVDGGDCVTAGGGPFNTIDVTGGPATPSFGWTLP